MEKKQKKNENLSEKAATKRAAEAAKAEATETASIAVSPKRPESETRPHTHAPATETTKSAEATDSYARKAISPLCINRWCYNQHEQKHRQTNERK